MSTSFQVEGVQPDTKTLLNMARRELDATGPVFFKHGVYDAIQALCLVDIQLGDGGREFCRGDWVH